MRLPDWDTLEMSVPAVAATMRRYLSQFSGLMLARTVTAEGSAAAQRSNSATIALA